MRGVVAALGDGQCIGARRRAFDGTSHRWSLAPADGCAPSEAVITAIGIRETYWLARSRGVRLPRRQSLVAKSRPARSIERPRTLETPKKRCVTTKAMIVSCRRSDRLTPRVDGRPRKFRRQKECRSRIGTRWNSDRDYRLDWSRSSRPHLLTAGTHAGVITFT